MDAFVVDHPGAKSSAPPHCDAIMREVVDRFRRSGYQALSDVSCDLRDNAIDLGVRLPSYYRKQIALAVAADVDGVQLRREPDRSDRPGPA